MISFFLEEVFTFFFFFTNKIGQVSLHRICLSFTRRVSGARLLRLNNRSWGDKTRTTARSCISTWPRRLNIMAPRYLVSNLSRIRSCGPPCHPNSTWSSTPVVSFSWIETCRLTSPEISPSWRSSPSCKWPSGLGVPEASCSACTMKATQRTWSCKHLW